MSRRLISPEPRRKPGMRTTIEDILGKHGKTIESLKHDEHYKVTNEPYTPLSLDYLGKKCGMDAFSVAHNSIQNGDVMADPDMEFLDDGESWHPATFQNDYVGIFQEVYGCDEKKIQTVKPRLKKELESFAKTWARNLREQGFGAKKAKLVK